MFLKGERGGGRNPTSTRRHLEEESLKVAVIPSSTKVSRRWIRPKKTGIGKDSTKAHKEGLHQRKKSEGHSEVESEIIRKGAEDH